MVKDWNPGVQRPKDHGEGGEDLQDHCAESLFSWERRNILGQHWSCHDVMAQTKPNVLHLKFPDMLVCRIQPQNS